MLMLTHHHHPPPVSIRLTLRAYRVVSLTATFIVPRVAAGGRFA